MSIKTTIRIASRVIGAGTSRIMIMDPKAAKDALTADDVRELIKEGAIKVRPKAGVGRGKAARKQSRKEEGRRRGEGSRKGKKFAKTPSKDRWMEKVRSQRLLLSRLKPRLKKGAYRDTYLQIKGNAFKTKKELLAHLVGKGLLQ